MLQSPAVNVVDGREGLSAGTEGRAGHHFSAKGEISRLLRKKNPPKAGYPKG